MDGGHRRKVMAKEITDMNGPASVGLVDAYELFKDAVSLGADHCAFTISTGIPQDSARSIM